jgi:hypothetical protein
MSESDDPHAFAPHPSFGPGDETVVSDDSFAALCMTRTEEEVRNLGWRFRTSILTQSVTWGLVWRADYEAQDQTAESSCMRLICWCPPGEEGVAGTAFIGVEPGERLK